MPLATPEQLKIERRRRKGWGTTCIVVGVLWIVSLIVMQQFGGDGVAGFKVFTRWLFGGASILLFTAAIAFGRSSSQKP